MLVRAASEAKAKGVCSSKVRKTCKYCNPIMVDLCGGDVDDEEEFKKVDTKPAPLFPTMNGLQMYMPSQPYYG